MVQIVVLCRSSQDDCAYFRTLLERDPADERSVVFVSIVGQNTVESDVANIGIAGVILVTLPVKFGAAFSDDCGLGTKFGIVVMFQDNAVEDASRVGFRVNQTVSVVFGRMSAGWVNHGIDLSSGVVGISHVRIGEGVRIINLPLLSGVVVVVGCRGCPRPD